MADRISESEFWDMAEDLVLDLRAVFGMIEDDARETFSKGVSSDKTPEEIISDVEGIL